MYTMLVCDFPFNDNTFQGLSKKIQNVEPDQSRLTLKKVSPECVKLISNMLMKDKTKRQSIQECLNDPWFQMNTSDQQNNEVDLNTGVKEEALVCLQSYQKLNKLFKAIRLLNVKLGKQCSNLKELRNLFLSYDKGNKSQLNKEEFLMVCDQISSGTMSVYDKDKMFSLIDINNDERVDYDEFIAIFYDTKVMNEDILVE